MLLALHLIVISLYVLLATNVSHDTGPFSSSSSSLSSVSNSTVSPLVDTTSHCMTGVGFPTAPTHLYRASSPCWTSSGPETTTSGGGSRHRIVLLILYHN